MTEYKGITRENSSNVWYWLDTYCKNKDPLVLENDIVLQSKVKKYYLKRRAYIIFINAVIWIGLAYSANILFKG